jgi:hypothetical protein
MKRKLLRTLLGAGLVLALSQACAPTSAPLRQPVVASVEYYYGPSPFYYDRRVVYYDASGRPIYFVAGVWRRVPVHYRHYEVIVRDYHRHREEYRHERRRHAPPPPPRARRERPPRRRH